MAIADPIIFDAAGGSSNSSPGSGNVSLDNTIAGLQAISAACTSGDTVQARIETADGSEWEVGIYTVTTGSPWTLDRAGAQTVLESSNSDAAVTFTAAVNVRLTVNADYLNALFLPSYTHSAPTTGNATMQWLKSNRIDLSSMTADRNLIVPTPPFLGARMEIVCTTAHTSYGGVIIGDTGISIGSASAASEWSRFIMARERVILRAVSATVIDVEHDGRIPVTVGIQKSGMSASLNVNEFIIPWGTGNVYNDNSGGADTANHTFILRRAGTSRSSYKANAQARTDFTGMTSNQWVNLIIKLNGGNFGTAGAATFIYEQIHGSNIVACATSTATVDGSAISARDTIDWWIDTSNSVGTLNSFVAHVHEVLNK